MPRFTERHCLSFPRNLGSIKGASIPRNRYLTLLATSASQNCTPLQLPESFSLTVLEQRTDSRMAAYQVSTKDLLDFSRPWELSDVVLMVEGKRFYVHRSILALWSPVFSRMFTADFKEKSAQVVPLPGKKSSEIEEMLLVIYPTSSKRINELNYLFLLDLAREYMMKKLAEKCEDFLMNTLRCPRQAPLLCLDLLDVAQDYRLERLQEACINKAQNRNFRELTKHSIYDKINLHNYQKIIEGMIQNLECDIQKLEWDIQQLRSERGAMEDKVRKVQQNSKIVESYALDAIKKFEDLVNTLAKVVCRGRKSCKSCACSDSLEDKLDTICGFEFGRNESPFAELRDPLSDLDSKLNEIQRLAAKV